MKLAHKPYRELEADQIRCLTLVEQMKPGYQLAIRAGLQSFVDALPDNDSSPMGWCAVSLLQAIRSRD